MKKVVGKETDCKENDDQQPKIWYTIKYLSNAQPQEVRLGMESNTSHNRVLVNLEHSLIFRKFFTNDTGFYYCIGLEAQESENKFSYLVDAVFPNKITSETGNLSKWNTYHDEYFKPINKLFKTSNGDDFIYIRNNLSIGIELVTEWEGWGSCEVCGRAQGNAIRRKKGFCRLKLTSIGNGTVKGRNEDELFFLDSYELSCKSQLIARLFPTVSNITRLLPHFVVIEGCEGSCNPGTGKGWKTGKSLDFKYKKSYVLAESTHLTLICPESSIDNVVIWRKNGKVITPGENFQSKNPKEEPRIIVDTFNTLYLHDVTSQEEGNYTCQVDNIRMQQVKVFVVSKSRILTQAFVRHMMYLAFVLSLTFSCYCAGLFITWTKRHTFKSYEELVEEDKKNYEDSDED
ncbi:hypothetical protein RN001_002627 [Aquatica leii]|uniref:Ig-like domain-containing protein n=1 Tax=Aquatica leii TaxID=1421715 RepID=A0AAN7PQ33_9COLE|nr:hypothetical protein RN001_002627 [Aquatica leii]